MRSTATPPRPRDREATRRRIIAAVGSVLAADGFRALGINAVARRAGVDKVLVYRYFGGLPQLLAAYAEEGDFWWRESEVLPPEETPGSFEAAVGAVFRRHIAAIRARPETLEIMAWETIERNELTAALAEVRERRSLAVMMALVHRFAVPQAVDIAAVAALFGAATNYLMIRARGIRFFQGLDLGDETGTGWERLLAAITTIAGRIVPP